MKNFYVNKIRQTGGSQITKKLFGGHISETGIKAARELATDTPTKCEIAIISDEGDIDLFFISSLSAFRSILNADRA